MQTLQRNNTPIRMRNYGRIIEQMVQVAAYEPDDETRQQMTLYIARCMRQKNQIWNKDQEAGLQRIKDDIYELSGGRISCDLAELEQDSKQRNNAPQPQPVHVTQNNKKKKKA